MSQVPSTSTSSTSFESIFSAALKAYKKDTKKDIVSHPLATQLGSCDSPSAILAILRTQVQTFDQSQGSDEKWTKWLDPTVNVLFAFSATLGNGAGVVNCETLMFLEVSLTCVTTGVPTGKCDIHRNWSPPASEHLRWPGMCVLVTKKLLRLLRMSALAKILLSTSLAVWNTFSSVSRHI
jgi:hypothetical protein